MPEMRSFSCRRHENEAGQGDEMSATQVAKQQQLSECLYHVLCFTSVPISTCLGSCPDCSLYINSCITFLPPPPTTNHNTKKTMPGVQKVLEVSMAGRRLQESPIRLQLQEVWLRMIELRIRLAERVMEQ